MFKVTYTGKTGNSESATFYSRGVAEAYARTIPNRNPTIQDLGGERKDTPVEKGPVATLARQARNTSAFIKAHRAGEKFLPEKARKKLEKEERFAREEAEREAEMFAEFFNSQHGKMTREEALKIWQAAG